MESLLSQMLEEQRKTNSLLSILIQSQAALIDALSDDDQGDDQQEPATYMDGTPCR